MDGMRAKYVPSAEVKCDFIMVEVLLKWGLYVAKGDKEGTREGLGLLQ